ncbi:hypothetical protein [Pantoea sp. At-9b]|uniref:carbapenem self-resistance protein CarG family protein n=1 Tax=Pantoea sp. (strain At-9b) TaxID=592316 RepID=UPI0001B3DEB0|nr:hypothetical protein [Pantoea sp. At-9b]ADU71469.1 conserved hypothetical protein [Pantoea sp. At-9b]
MNYSIFFLLLLWVISGTAAISPVTLKPGPNYLDLNHDGTKDLVVMAQFDNNTSHPNIGLTFFIRCTGGGYCIMPVANSNLFTWFDYRLSADAEFLVQDNRLFQYKNRFYLISVQKVGDDVFESGKIEIKIYKFSESRDDPGVPLYDWTLHKKALTKKEYLSATEAYQDIDVGLLDD